MVGGNQHSSGARNLTFNTVPKTEPSDASRQSPQQSVDDPAHDPVDTATIICSTT